MTDLSEDDEHVHAFAPTISAELLSPGRWRVAIAPCGCGMTQDAFLTQKIEEFSNPHGSLMKAMAAESVPVDVAERVVNRWLYGHHRVTQQRTRARAIGTPERSRRRRSYSLTDGFLREIAERYRELLPSTRSPARIIAQEKGVSHQAVYQWCALARERGYLAPRSN